MQFTAWQLDTLRKALNNYRIAKARNGRPFLPWRVVLDHILMSKATRHEYPEDGEEPDFKEEALRRFAAGSNDSQPDKLEDIKNFLMAEGYLSAAELDTEPGNLQELLAVRSYLANDSEEARRYLSRIQLAYEADRSTSARVDKIKLKIALDPSGLFFRVEEVLERRHLMTGPKSELDRRVEDRDIRQIRMGYGFVSTPQLLAHIFLCGPSRDDRVTYLQAEPAFDQQPIVKMYLMRTGIPTSFSFRRDREDGPFTMHNVLRFMPNVLAEIQTPEKALR